MATSDTDSLIHKPEGSTINPDLSKPLPTEVRAANNPEDRKYDTGAAAEFVSPHGTGQVHSAEYYAQWRKETQEKIANGEDYYADFARRARERSSQSTVTGRLFSGVKSKPEKEKTKTEPEKSAKVEAAESRGWSKLFGKKKAQPDDVVR